MELPLFIKDMHPVGREIGGIEIRLGWLGNRKEVREQGQEIKNPQDGKASHGGRIPIEAPDTELKGREALGRQDRWQSGIFGHVLTWRLESPPLVKRAMGLYRACSESG